MIVLIRPFYDQELIKVLIGIRRSGKSVILKQIIDELKENILREGKKEQIGVYLENIVYNELIATRFNEKIYIQVAYILSDETVIDREFNAYKKIEDNYPKYVLSMDKFDMSQNGIINKNIIDWLLKKIIIVKNIFIYMGM